MTHRSSPPLLIKGIDEIVRRHSNEVNHSALNGTNIESGRQPENEIQQKYRKYGLQNKEKKYTKEGKYTAKNAEIVK